MSTRAPLVMASRAALNWSLPCGNSTVYWGGLSPASLNASFRYFASNFLKCGAVASLGRMTAMLPVPLAASGLRADMALNLLLTWISENCGPDDLAPPGELEDGLPVQLQQAARTRARAAQPAHAVRAAPLTERNGPPHISHHHPVRVEPAANGLSGASVSSPAGASRGAARKRRLASRRRSWRRGFLWRRD